ncbi:MAG: hypothetical protein KBT21_08535 [Treponema sp.]|nr:hypothetical protein [Candidatus Treponema merdequi]
MLSSPLFATKLKAQFTQDQLERFIEKLSKLIAGEIVYFDVIEEKILKEISKVV